MRSHRHTHANNDVVLKHDVWYVNTMCGMLTLMWYELHTYTYGRCDRMCYDVSRCVTMWYITFTSVCQKYQTKYVRVYARDEAVGVDKRLE